MTFDVGQGTQDLGYRNEVPILFMIRPARIGAVAGARRNGRADGRGLCHSRRAGPRLSVARQAAWRPTSRSTRRSIAADGELVKLPAGKYKVEFWRGPESITKTRSSRSGSTSGAARVGADASSNRALDRSRKFGWWSGDHHIHAAGCAHYTNPTEGVHAPDMMRHCLGEDLKVGATSPGVPASITRNNSSPATTTRFRSTPICSATTSRFPALARINPVICACCGSRRRFIPGGDSDEHWPTLCLNTLRWAKKQGAVCGPAHSGWGLEVNTAELPNYIVPPFNGIGANEYIVDVTHEVPGPDGKPVRAVDFISTVDTPYVWELNIWYHTLNVGFRTRISGETDFPCIYGERVGLGRSYVKLDGKLDYDDWCEGIRQGRNYVSDGRSHLLDFKVNDVRMGENGASCDCSAAGPVKVHRPGRRAAERKAQSRTREAPLPGKAVLGYRARPHRRHSRSAGGTHRQRLSRRETRTSSPMAQLQDLSFDVKIERSSWVALRILPSSHTNPIFVLVGGKPIRASRRSAEWCLKGVDQCWSQKERFIKRDEMEQAKADYEHARRTYQRLITESEVE